MTKWKGLITSDPNVMMGKPVVDGTRITVELVLEKLRWIRLRRDLRFCLLSNRSEHYLNHRFDHVE